MLITDYDMPEMNGRELIKKIKLIDKELKTILISGAGSEPKLPDKDEQEYDLFIPKPFEYKFLHKKIQEILKRRSRK